jgi:hypothetical protein
MSQMSTYKTKKPSELLVEVLPPVLDNRLRERLRALMASSVTGVFDHWHPAEAETYLAESVTALSNRNVSNLFSAAASHGPVTNVLAKKGGNYLGHVSSAQADVRMADRQRLPYPLGKSALRHHVEIGPISVSRTGHRVLAAQQRSGRSFVSDLLRQSLDRQPSQLPVLCYLSERQDWFQETLDQAGFERDGQFERELSAFGPSRRLAAEPMQLWTSDSVLEAANGLRFGSTG